MNDVNYISQGDQKTETKQSMKRQRHKTHGSVVEEDGPFLPDISSNS